jgi:hypothetical protein
MKRTRTTTGIAKLDRVWQATTAVFHILASLPPEEREIVVNAANEHWRALPVVAAVGGGTADEPAQLFDGVSEEPVPQLPPLRGSQRAAE